jgi:hypothetical protein
MQCPAPPALRGNDSSGQKASRRGAGAWRFRHAQRTNEQSFRRLDCERTRATAGRADHTSQWPNKFLPFDFEFNRYPDFDLDRVFKDRGIKTIITVGTQVQTAVLHTAAEAALRGYKVIVPVDGMSGDSLYPEQYTAWHLTHTQRIMQQVTLTRVNLVGY